jgi:hypothetical protein
MLNGPLSERIDSIIEKLQVVNLIKMKKMKSKKNIHEKFTLQSEENIEAWESTQFNCPIPSRNPDPWVH